MEGNLEYVVRDESYFRKGELWKSQFSFRRLERIEKDHVRENHNLETYNLMKL